jgi:hypothetical protein
MGSEWFSRKKKNNNNNNKAKQNHSVCFHCCVFFSIFNSVWFKNIEKMILFSKSNKVKGQIWLMVWVNGSGTKKKKNILVSLLVKFIVFFFVFQFLISFLKNNVSKMNFFFRGGEKRQIGENKKKTVTETSFLKKINNKNR